MLKALGEPHQWGLHPSGDFCPSHLPTPAPSSPSPLWAVAEYLHQWRPWAQRVYPVYRNEGEMSAESLLDASVIFQVPPVPTTVAQLGCETPRQSSPGRCHGFPYIHPQLRWLRNAIFKILRLIFSKKYLYLHRTIKFEQLSPRSFCQVEPLLDMCTSPYVQATASLNSTLPASSASSGVKNYFFVPSFLPSLPVHTARSVFTTGTWIWRGCLYTAQLASAERGSGWGCWARSAIFKCFQVAKPTFGADETHFLLQKTFFTRSAHLKKKVTDQVARALPRALPCTRQRESQPGCFLLGDTRVCRGFWSRLVSPASPVARSQARDG